MLIFAVEHAQFTIDRTLDLPACIVERFQCHLAPYRAEARIETRFVRRFVIARRIVLDHGGQFLLQLRDFVADTQGVRFLPVLFIDRLLIYRLLLPDLIVHARKIGTRL